LFIGIRAMLAFHAVRHINRIIAQVEPFAQLAYWEFTNNFRTK
jgi:hypothetical protein